LGFIVSHQPADVSLPFFDLISLVCLSEETTPNVQECHGNLCQVQT
jgi:hypothetical protein